MHDNLCFCFDFLFAVSVYGLREFALSVKLASQHSPAEVSVHGPEKKAISKIAKLCN